MVDCIFQRRSQLYHTYDMLLLQCDFDMSPTESWGSVFPSPKPGWTFVSSVTNRIWWNWCSVTSKAVSSKLHALLPSSRGMLTLRTQLTYSEGVQMGTTWTKHVQAPCAGFPSNSPAAVPANRNTNHQTCEWRYIQVIPGPNYQVDSTLSLPRWGSWHSALQISHPWVSSFRLCEHNKMVVWHHYVLGWFAVQR